MCVSPPASTDDTRNGGTSCATRMEDVIPVSRLIRSTMSRRARVPFFVIDRSLISARNPFVPSSPSRNRHRFVELDVENTFSRCQQRARIQNRARIYSVTPHLADVTLASFPRDINYSHCYTSRLFRMQREIIVGK